jgi:hypothetical protein
LCKGYREKAGMSQPIHPHLFRHHMLTYLTTKGLSDAQIQLISGHESKKSLEVYQHLSLESVDKAYQDAVQSVEIQRDFCGLYVPFVGLTPTRAADPPAVSTQRPSEVPSGLLDLRKSFSVNKLSFNCRRWAKVGRIKADSCDRYNGRDDL